MVALLDAADVAAATKTWRFAQQRIQSFSSVLRHDGSARFDRSIFTIVKKALRKAKNLTAYLAGQRLRDLRDGTRMRLFRFYVDRGFKVPRALAHISRSNRLSLRREGLQA